MSVDSSRIFGVRVDKVSRGEVFAWASDRIARRIHGCNIVVVNAAKVVKAHEDAELLATIEKADVVLADGLPIVWASRLLGDPVPEKIAGVDLMHEFLALANEHGWSIFFFGATEQVIVGVVARVCRDFPRTVIAGYRNGYFRPEDEEQIVRSIAATKPNLLFLGFGSPQKEHFVEKWKDQLGANIIHGVGGSFDVFVGKVRRAPVWMQNSGLEWVFRLLQEPRRMFRRYAVTNTVFLWLLFGELIRVNLRRLRTI